MVKLVGRDLPQDADMGLTGPQGVLPPVQELQGLPVPGTSQERREGTVLTLRQLQGVGELLLLHEQSFVPCPRNDAKAFGVFVRFKFSVLHTFYQSFTAPQARGQAVDRPGSIGLT